MLQIRTACQAINGIGTPALHMQGRIAPQDDSDEYSAHQRVESSTKKKRCYDEQRFEH
jgi:hypothetical protein